MTLTNTRRRWASRKPRPSRKRFSKRKTSSGQRNKTKVPHKPRLVKRHVRRKTDDTKTRPNAKHLQPSGSAPSDSRLKAAPATTKASAPLLHNDVAVDRKTTSRPAVMAEVTAIPNPIPDSGITAAVVSTTAVPAGSPLLGGVTFNSDTSGLSIVNPVAISAFTSTGIHGLTLPTSFSPLPPLESLSTFTSETVGVRPAEKPTQATSSATASATSASSIDPQARQLSAAMVILLSVGGGLFLLGFCIVVKMCSKPRRKARPTPSLPIMKDLEADDEDFYETKESPLFGGEERMSAANGPMWNWVQYPHTKLSGPTAPAPVQPTYSSQQNPNAQNHSYPHESGFHLATHPPPSIAPSTDTQTPDNYAVRTAFHTVPMVPASKRASRQSFYAPAEPSPDNARQDTAFTADGHDVLKRSKSKGRRQSQLGMDDRKNRNSTVSFVGLAYDGEDATSPAPVEYGHVVQDPPNLNSDYAGRARVKSGYFAAGTYPRMSTLPSTTYSIATATRINVGQRNSFSKDKLQKGNSKRIRDTQALTYALGLASPRTEYGPPSPQPTLYPDDSLSVADGRRPKKGERVPDVPVIVPMDNVGSSDTLMGMSFGVSQMSLTGLNLEPVTESSGESSSRQAEAGSGSSATSSSSSIQVHAQGSRTGDRPPRVPSPPALPSLAQMGLARNNPEAYDTYRSPTYSLYGLYQTADRKSYAGR